MAPLLCLGWGLLGTLSLALFFQQSWPLEPWSLGLVAAVLILLLRSTLGVKWPKGWRRSHAIGLSLWWVGWTLQESALGLASLVRHDWGSLDFLLSQTWPCSLAIGILYLCARGPKDAEIAAISPLAMAPIVAVSPQGAGLYLIPLLAALGFFPVSRKLPTAAWSDALATLVEMASLQTVAWTVVFTLVNTLGELAHLRYLDALFSFFATAAVGGIGSGLLWGLSLSLGTRETPTGQSRRR